MRFSRKRKPYLTVLDIGTSKVCCLVIRINSDDKPEVIGVGYAPAKGIRNGTIVDLDKATDCVRSALEQAERQSERTIDKVIVNISSSQLRSVQYYEETEILDGYPITAGDVKRLVDGSISSHIMAGEEVIHSFPLSYVVNKEQGVEPRGMYGPSLGVHMHLVVLPESQSRNLVAVLDSCHVGIEMKVATPYAAALAVLSEEEKEVGVTVLDMGAGATQYATFLGDCLVNLGTIHAGGNAMTKDIAQGLGCSLANAERLKTLNGAAFLSPKDELERLIVPVLGDEEGSNIQIPRSDLISIIIPRVDWTLSQVAAKFDEVPQFQAALHRIVLSGGASSLQGMKEKAADYLSASVCMGKCGILKGLPNQFDSYTFSTCIGLMRYAIARRQTMLTNSSQKFDTNTGKSNFIRKGMQWLAQNF